MLGLHRLDLIGIQEAPVAACVAIPARIEIAGQVRGLNRLRLILVEKAGFAA